jgi:hypothetical protein
MESTASLSTLAQMIDTKKMLQVCCSVFCLLLYFYLYKKYSLNLIHVPY